MSYLSKQTIVAAYHKLSNLDSNKDQGLTQKVSILKYLSALDMFHQKYDNDCDLKVSRNRDLFASCVGEVVKINESLCTKNFYKNITHSGTDFDCGSNFYSQSSVKESKISPEDIIKYPKRSGWAPVMDVHNQVLCRNVEYYSSCMSYYLPNSELRFSFVIWLLRFRPISEENIEGIKSALQEIFSEELCTCLFNEHFDESLLSGVSFSDNLATLSLEDFGFTTNTFSENILPIQEIRYGAPGTGKSQGLKNKDNTIRITFHPDTDHASFVGCYKPVMSDKNIKYAFAPQAFFDAYVKAWNNPTKEHHLLIEEINRGDCAQIFGDIFQLLDRDDNGFSDYPIKADTDMWVELKKVLPNNYVDYLTSYYKNSQGSGFSGEGMIALPPNFSIIATMNTSDNSLYKMDSAFKRRWDWEYIPIKYDEPLLLGVVLEFADNGEDNWLSILKRINKFIKENTGSTAKQIGQWFAKPKRNQDGVNEDGSPIYSYTHIDQKTFINKVLFFLFNDVFKDRDELKSLFGKDNEEFLFEDLVTAPDLDNLLKTFIKNLPEIEAR